MRDKHNFYPTKNGCSRCCAHFEILAIESFLGREGWAAPRLFFTLA